MSTADRPGTAGRPTTPVAATPHPPIPVPREPLARYDAKVLDPAAAARVAGQREVRSTVYLRNRLLVSAAAGDLVRDELTRAAAEKGLRFVPPLNRQQRHEQLVSAARQAGHDRPEDVPHTPVHLEPLEGVAATADAWEVLQSYRARIGTAADHTRHVGLDHLLFGATHIHIGPFGPGAESGAPASASYAAAGTGGRMPVSWLGAPPLRSADAPARRPAVAVLDTGCGVHDWLPDGVVDRAPTVDGTPGGVPIGLAPNALDGSGVLTDPLEGVLDGDAGHGTFIAGLIRQLCPDANILAIPVVPGYGAVPEHVLLDALTALICRQRLAKSGRPELFVDVVSLSLGYYDEFDDPCAPTPLTDALDELAALGTVVVAAAGNDATTRPMMPAARCPHPAGPAPDAGRVPVLSVGATNPDGSVALFSNAGPWVLCHRPGANLVSTFPTTMDGSAQPAFRTVVDGEDRATLDPDTFTSGFGTWSGTSFAAPVLAGEIAAALLRGTPVPLESVDDATAVTRAWAAIGSLTTLVRP